MRIETAVEHEACQNLLLQWRDVLGQQRLRCREGIDQPRRTDQVADPERREQGLGKTAHIEHPAAAVQGLHRRQCPLGIAELAVVIVLHDPAPLLLRAVEQFQPAVEAHGDAEGMLVRRRDEDQPGTRMALPCVFEIEPVPVDRHVLHVRAEQAHGIPNGDVARVFTPDNRAALDQRQGDQHERLLCAGCDHNLVLVAPDAPVVPHMQPDGLLQFRQPARRAVAEQGVLPASHDPGMGRGPCPARKQVKRRHPGAEGRNAAEPGGRLRCRDRACTLRQRGLAAAPPDPAARDLRGQLRDGDIADERSRAPARFQKSFGDQLLEDILDRLA